MLVRPDQADAGQQRDVLGSSSHVGSQPGRRRVDDRDPGDAWLQVKQPVVQDASGGSELDPVVDAGGLRRVRGGQRLHRLTVTDQQRDDVRQVLLALRVVGRQPFEGVPQVTGRKGVDAGRYLTDLTGDRVGVALFDHLAHRPVTGPLTHHPAVSGGIVDNGREQGGRGVVLVMQVEECSERLRTQQRRIARYDHHGVTGRQLPRRVQCLQRHPHRVAGAQLLLLDHWVDAGLTAGLPAWQAPRDQVATGADDD